MRLPSLLGAVVIGVVAVLVYVIFFGPNAIAAGSAKNHLRVDFAYTGHSKPYTTTLTNSQGDKTLVSCQQFWTAKRLVMECEVVAPKTKTSSGPPA